MLRTPVLTAAGQARKTILDLCDGTRPVADIEAEVERRHASLTAFQAKQGR